MDIYILDSNFKFNLLIDVYQSVVWTERFFEAGDFEIYLPLETKYLTGDNAIQQGQYVTTSDTETIMVIEKMEIKKDLEGTDSLILVGRSLESILSRRIVWKTKRWELKNPFDIITDVVKSAFCGVVCEHSSFDMDERDGTRKVSNFVLADDVYGLREYIEANYVPKITRVLCGENVYDLVVEFCKHYEIGFKMGVTFDENDNPIITMKFYRGEDRSENQPLVYEPMELANGTFIDNPNGHYKNKIVDLSERFDNCNASEYSCDEATYRNIALIGGPGEGPSQLFVKHVSEENASEPTGLNRREIYVKSKDEDVLTDYTKDYYLDLCINLLREKYFEIQREVRYGGSTSRELTAENFASMCLNEKKRYNADHKIDPSVKKSERLEKTNYKSEFGHYGLLTVKTKYSPINAIKKLIVKLSTNTEQKPGSSITESGTQTTEEGKNDTFYNFYFIKDEKTIYDRAKRQYKKRPYDILAPDSSAKNKWNAYYYSENANDYRWTGGVLNEKRIEKFTAADKAIKKALEWKKLSNKENDAILKGMRELFEKGIGDYFDLWAGNIAGVDLKEDEERFMDSYSINDDYINDINGLLLQAVKGSLSPFTFYLINNKETNKIDVYIWENPTDKTSNLGKDNLMYGRLHELLCYFMPVTIEEFPLRVRKAFLRNVEDPSLVDDNPDPELDDIEMSKYTTEDEGKYGRFYYYKYNPIALTNDTNSAKNSFKAACDSGMQVLRWSQTLQKMQFKEPDKNDIPTTRFPLWNKNILIYLGSMDNILESALKEKSNRVIGRETRTETFSADIEVHGSYKPNDDYFLGDIVNLSNEYDGMEISETALVSEMTYSYEQSGNHLVPTLSLL